MHRVDLYLKQEDVKLSNPCIISMSVQLYVNPSIMVVVVAMQTHLRRKISANMSAKSTVRRTTLFFPESHGNRFCTYSYTFD